jgi:hypothetical protein
MSAVNVFIDQRVVEVSAVRCRLLRCEVSAVEVSLRCRLLRCRLCRFKNGAGDAKKKNMTM